MPKCDICGKDVPRRVRQDSRLVCGICDNLITFPHNAAYEVHRQRKQLEEYKAKWNLRKPNIKHKFNSPFSAIPPIHVLENAILALDTEGKYTSFPVVLSDYYGIDSPPFWDNPDEVPKNAIACYSRIKNVVYSKGSMSRHTAFHEIWHALESFGIVPYDPETSEKHANLYASGCISSLSKGERTP